MASQLFFLSLADIFSVYPTIFKSLISTRAKPVKVFLPSDPDWQDKMYCRLLDIQKRLNDALDGGQSFDEAPKSKKKPVFDPLLSFCKFSPCSSPSGLDKNRKVCLTKIKFSGKLQSSWSMKNIAKAAKLLRKPQLPVQFENEHEMRKVYSLIYDVFRYKIVLTNTLNDISFYETFPEYKGDESRIWLMLYELYERQFRKRKPEELGVEKELYCDAEIKALNLTQLLPIHLQNEKVAIAASNPVVTGWINPFLIRDKITADKYLAKMGLHLQSDGLSDTQQLKQNQYTWDNVCPLFLSCIPEDRNEFTKSTLMTKHFFIMQDRTFSFGPAIMAQLLDFFELDGDILQTHISSPRSTAYLAALFHSVNRVNNFYVYGAGSHIKEYRIYMESLGVTNIRLFAEPFALFPLESRRFDTVVGIFACPSNSFSAISDPIDLICSRGGDLSMLEVLTESEINDDGKHRVSLILEEQLLTLQKAMSRAHTQFILYQTHSIVKSENQDMVDYAVNLINNVALEKHRTVFREKKRLEALAELEAANIPSAAKVGDSKSKIQSQTESSFETDPNPKSKVELSEDKVTLPDADEFVFEEIPDICINQDGCIYLQSTGCFFSLVKRKNITQLNAQYLIKMAEVRGLFGKPNENKSDKQKLPKAQDTLEAKKSLQLQQLFGVQRKTHTNINSIIARLLQHTNASCNRSKMDKLAVHPIIFNCKREECSIFLRPRLIQSWKTLQRIKFRWTLAFKYIQHRSNVSQKRKLRKSKKEYFTRPKFSNKKIMYPLKHLEIRLAPFEETLTAINSLKA